jgi:drug/metabolite transporter (DMT)-like permease
VAQPHLSSTWIGVVLAIVAAVFYAGFVLYGAWIDGKRQKLREKGQHPVTESTGEVHAREDEEVQEHSNGSRRDG